MKRLLYLGYFICKTDYRALRTSAACAARRGYHRLQLYSDMLYSSLRYGSSFMDYFNFRFYEKNHSLRAQYATMGYMYRFHRAVNDPEMTAQIDNKVEFAKRFGKFCACSYHFTHDRVAELRAFLERRCGKKIVVKDPDGTAGSGVSIIDIEKVGALVMIGGKPLDAFLAEAFKTAPMIYIEDYLEQHDRLKQISPTAVNTIRMITMLRDDGDVEIIGSILRISVSCPIDNYSAGNLAAEIDPRTGVVVTGGIRKQSSCDDYHNHHPATGSSIKGFVIPCWESVLRIVKEAAQVVPEVRSVGWDIAITRDGPIIIEGNSKWNKDTWQIPAGYGKKHMIARYV